MTDSPQAQGDFPSPGTAPPDHRLAPPLFDRHMLEALVCPLTHGRLDYDAARQELVSQAAGLAFPIRDGIPIMLIGEARQIKAD
ncbi:hypothetical protein B0A89_07915 [Paracoccus contaminans]|uniref:UPF0434 protein B0A89_07915 n=2 Tax=Paracoccus contaminans TaxID=1945662 RepID=A0A1W6CXP9_9RHOB|nr:hypothetical protein B0A89_07915 [Paracoccus contaminans]